MNFERERKRSRRVSFAEEIHTVRLFEVRSPLASPTHCRPRNTTCSHTHGAQHPPNSTKEHDEHVRIVSAFAMALLLPHGPASVQSGNTSLQQT